MRKLIFIILALTAISCCRKSVAKSSPVELYKAQKESSDSAISKALAIVSNKDSIDCKETALQVIILSQRLSDCESANADLNIIVAEKPKEKETIIVDKRKTKYRNSFNDIQKNSNNSTEIIKLKNSILVKDSAIANLVSENFLLNSKLKEKPKKVAKKGSAIGDGNTITTKKNTWWWIFVAGYLFCHVLHKIVIPLLMRFIPFANVVGKAGSLFTKLKFWT